MLLIYLTPNNLCDCCCSSHFDALHIHRLSQFESLQLILRKSMIDFVIKGQDFPFFFQESSPGTSWTRSLAAQSCEVPQSSKPNDQVVKVDQHTARLKGHCSEGLRNSFVQQLV